MIALNIRKFWNRLFADERRCRNYVEGLCLDKVMDDLFDRASQDHLSCEMCNEFETLFSYLERKNKEELKSEKKG